MDVVLSRDAAGAVGINSDSVGIVATRNAVKCGFAVPPFDVYFVGNRCTMRPVNAIGVEISGDASSAFRYRRCLYPGNYSVGGAHVLIRQLYLKSLRTQVCVETE